MGATVAEVVVDTFDPTFQPGGEFSVGVEEELLLVDEQGVLLGAAATPVVQALRRVTTDRGVVTGEIFADQLELNTPVCANADEVARSLGELRSSAVDAGARLMAVGVHPTAPLGEVSVSRSTRYETIAEEYGGLLRTPTSALQVHVGMPDADTMMSAYRGLRSRLPLLRALSACSPFWHGVDSGLASARACILRSYPRTTGAPRLCSWDEYVRRTAAIMAAAGVPDHTYVWWDLRPRPELGTVEVRVMDAQPSLERVAGLTALVQGLARWVVETPDQEDLPDVALEANDHRATRDGLEACVVDIDGSMRPLRQVGTQALTDARRVLGPDGLDAPLADIERMLSEPNEPARQRQVVEDRGLVALVEDLVTRTQAESPTARRATGKGGSARSA